MIAKIKHYDIDIEVSMSEDSTADDVLIMFIGVLHLLGYHEESIKRAIKNRAGNE